MDDQPTGTVQAVPAPTPMQPWEERPVTPIPRDARTDAQVEELAAAVPGGVEAAVELAGQITVQVPPASLSDVLRACKDLLGYDFLVDLTAVDWQDRVAGRFDVVYWLHRHRDQRRLRLKVAVADGVEVPSATGVWKTANWMEREVYDLFGLHFSGHPNLERILTWEGFNGHPLRKDFPIEGIDTGAAIYPDVFPPGGGPVTSEGNE